MPPFIRTREGSTLAIHGDSLTLQGDIHFLQCVPEPDIPPSRSVHVFAETVTIAGTVYTGGADLQISCRVLRLEHGAIINTLGSLEVEPVFYPIWSSSVGTSSRGRPGKQGRRGSNAGDVFIVCDAAVRVGPALEGRVTALKALTTRPVIVDKRLNAHVGSFVNSIGGSRTEQSPWLTVRAVGAWGGTGQDGEAGADGQDGAPKPYEKWTLVTNETVRTPHNNNIPPTYHDKCKGNDGKKGSRGGDGGDGGMGGDGGSFRFAVLHGTFSAADSTTPEADWVPALCTYVHHDGGGPAGQAGVGGSGGIGGMPGLGAEHSVTYRYRHNHIRGGRSRGGRSRGGRSRGGGSRRGNSRGRRNGGGRSSRTRGRNWVPDVTLRGMGDCGDRGEDGENGDIGNSSEACSGIAGSGPSSGAAFDTHQFVAMLNVDHLFRLRDIAEKARSTGTHGGSYLARQFHLIEFRAEFLLEHIEHHRSAAQTQLLEIAAFCEHSRQSLESGNPDFVKLTLGECMPETIPGATIRGQSDTTQPPTKKTTQRQLETPMRGINTIPPSAKPTQHYLKRFEDTADTNDIVASCENSRQPLESREPGLFGLTLGDSMPQITSGGTTRGEGATILPLAKKTTQEQPQTRTRAVDTIPPQAKKTTQQQKLERFEDKEGETNNEETKKTISSAVSRAMADLNGQILILVGLEGALDEQYWSIRRQQYDIARQWQGDGTDKRGLKSLMVTQEEFVESIGNWEPPPAGPEWLSIGGIISGTVSCAVVTGVAAEETTRPALSKRAASLEVIKTAIGTGGTMLCAAFDSVASGNTTADVLCAAVAGVASEENAKEAAGSVFLTQGEGEAAGSAFMKQGEAAAESALAEQTASSLEAVGAAIEPGGTVSCSSVTGTGVPSGGATGEVMQAAAAAVADASGETKAEAAAVSMPVKKAASLEAVDSIIETGDAVPRAAVSADAAGRASAEAAVSTLATQARETEGSALAKQEARLEVVKAIIKAGVVPTTINVSNELQMATQQEPSVEPPPVSITQDMSDILRQMAIESIDRATGSANAEANSYAIALKDAFREWLDLDRNASIMEYLASLVAHQQAKLDVQRLETQLVRVKEQAAKDHMALSEAFFRDDVDHRSVAFKTTIDLPEDAVEKLAIIHRAEIWFTNLPTGLEKTSDIMVHTVALRVGTRALTGSGHVTAGVCCDQDSSCAGICCYDVRNGTDDCVATLAGQGNAGARLEGTCWVIHLGYATNSTSIDFAKLMDPDGGVQLIVSGVGRKNQASCALTS